MSGNRKIIVIKRAARLAHSSGGELGNDVTVNVESGARTVFLEGSAWYSSYIVALREFEAQLFNYFVSKGWALRNLQLVPTGSSLNSLMSVQIKIETVVNPQYSDADVKAEAFNLLSNYSTSLGSYLTNIALDVSNSSTGKAPVKESDKPELLGGAFFTTLAATLGISVPVATVGGVLAAIWFLRR